MYADAVQYIAILPTGETMSESHDSYDERYFEPLAAVEAKHFWFRSRNQLIAGLIRKYCHANPAAPLYGMEIGCGTGNVLTFLTKQFPQQRLIGVDLFMEGLAVARRRGAELLVQADINHAPLAGKFSWIGLFDIIEHLDDDVQVLRETSSLLDENGLLFISVPAFPVLWSYFDVAGRHKRRYVAQTLQQSVEAAGLELVYAGYTYALLFPPMWVQRRLFQGNKAPETLSDEEVEQKTNDELRIIPVANAIVRLLLGLENRLIMAGGHLPFGTSMIAVAKRKR